ncbi:MAG: hypothetical protein WC988_02705 [Patescibacteria group bacterium]
MNEVVEQNIDKNLLSTITVPLYTKQLTAPSKPKKAIVIGMGVIGTVCILIVVYFFYLAPKFKQASPSSWNGIKPGVTTRESVIKKMGNPLSEKESTQGAFLQYTSEDKVFPNTVLIGQNNKVSSIFVQLSEKDNAKLSDWLKKYGKPEKEMFNYYLDGSKTYLYPNKGTTFVGVTTGDQVLSVQYYSPGSLEDYLNQWGGNFSETNPFEM